MSAISSQSTNVEPVQKPAAAIYARYSSDRQSPTSIEDQVRQCRELAEQKGYQVAEHHVFFDKAITGKREGLASREGFSALQAAVKSGELRCVVIDEVSRAGRDGLTLFAFIEELKSRNVRLLATSNGLDSHEPTFTMIYSMLTGMAAQESEQTRQRTSRGMLGVLERGGMVGYPPVGYKLLPREEGDSGRGATFAIDEPQADLVKSMFEARRAGKSYYQIADELQSQGIPIPRKAQKADGGYWRANTVKQVLSNTLYRGVFTWNGSSYALAKAKKQGQLPKTREFARPELRIIDEELWFACQPQPGKNPRKGYKHAYNRRVTCGVCSNSCTLHYRKNGVMLYCAVCEQRRRVLKDKNKYCQVSVRALDAVIRHALMEVDDDQVLEQYRHLLTGLVNQDKQAEIEKLSRQLKVLDSRIDVIAKMLTRGHGDALSLSGAYETVVQEREHVQTRLETIKKATDLVSPERIQTHVNSLSAKWYLDELFERVLDPSQANELVGRIFPKVVFTKSSKNVSHWEVIVNLQELQLPGGKTPMPDVGLVRMRFDVTCCRKAPVSYFACCLEVESLEGLSAET